MATPRDRVKLRCATCSGTLMSFWDWQDGWELRCVNCGRTPVDPYQKIFDLVENRGPVLH